MSDKTPFAGLGKVGTYLDEDLPKINENTDIIDAQLKQGHDERRSEEQTRAAADAALQAGLESEANTRHAEDVKLLGFVHAEAESRAEGDSSLQRDIETEVVARAAALQAHDANDAAHDALIRRITVGNLSPIIGVCQVETGNTTGLWFHVDGDCQPIQPNSRYFDYHPVYSGMRRVLVDGQVMVEIPVFYVKYVTAASGPFAGRPCKIISPTPLDGFKPYPAFLSQSGQVLDKIYIGAFQATNEGGSPVKLGSRPGKMPHVNETLAVMATKVANRNTDGVNGFHLWDIYEYNAVCLLFLIEYANTDSQAIMGRGWVDSTAAVTTDDQYQPYWRGLTGLLGNVWQFVDGLRLTASRQIEVFRNDGSRTWVNTGKVSPTYDGTNATRITALHTGFGDGFDCDDLILPSAHSTTTSLGMFPDVFYGGSGSAGNILFIGGTWHSAGGAGLFALNLNGAPSYSSTNIGCRSAKH